MKVPRRLGMFFLGIAGMFGQCVPPDPMAVTQMRPKRDQGAGLEPPEGTPPAGAPPDPGWDGRLPSLIVDLPAKPSGADRS